jgi:predicted glycoside hydrolase/deacetylase ChbG (UPF0249 family)
LFAAIALRWPGAAKPYLRAPDALGDGGDSGFKAWLLKLLCRGFSHDAQQLGYSVTPWFGGLYSLTAQADFAGLLQQWLRVCPADGLMMCHPGLPSADLSDPIGPARAAEYAYLCSAQFAADCLAAGVEIGRFRGC